MKKFIRASAIALALVCLVTVGVLAAYTATITVSENNTAGYDMLGVTALTNIDYMRDNEYISDNGLDTRVLLNSVAIPHMLAEDRLMFALSVAQSSTTMVEFTTGSTSLDAFYNIYGDNSSVAVTDHADLELGDDFLVVVDGWIDTTKANSNLLYKQDAFRLYISADGSVTATAWGDTETANVTATGVSSGEHEIEVIAPILQDNYALDFIDTNSDWVDCGNDSSLQFTSSFSVECWIKPDGGITSPLISKDSGNAGDRGWYFTLLSDNTVRFSVSADNTTLAFLTTNTTVLSATWTYLTGVYNAGNQSLSIYFNGDSQTGSVTGTVPASIWDTSVNVMLGRLSTTYAGTIMDEVRIYSRVLSDTDVTTNYSRGRLDSPLPYDQTDLELWHHIDEGTGTNLDDETANSNDGTITGADWLGYVAMGLYIDDVLQGTDVFRSSVVDNSNNWSTLAGNSAPYADSVKIANEEGKQTFFALDSPQSVDMSGWSNATYETVDATSYGVPTTATGVLLRVSTHDNWAGLVAFRKNGSTDDRYYGLGATSNTYRHAWPFVGVDNDNLFEVKLGNVSYISVEIIGYTGRGVVFLDNAVIKQVSANQTWEDIDVSANCPNAKGIILQMRHDYSYAGDGLARNMGVRSNGSTSTNLGTVYKNAHTWMIIGCDSSQIFEGYIDPYGTGTGNYFYIIGYVMAGAEFFTSKVDVTPSSYDVWETGNLTSYINPAIAFIETSGGMVVAEVGFRSSAGDSYTYTQPREVQHYIVPVILTSNDTYQAYVEDQITQDTYLYLVGYAHETIYDLWFEPVDIIAGTTLPDRGGDIANDGSITWGSNPSGITVTFGTLIPTGLIAPTIPEDVVPDIAPEITEPSGMYQDTAPASNVLTPMVDIIVDTTGTPANFIWWAFCLICVIGGVALTYAKFPNFIIAGSVGLVVIGAFVALGPIPWWFLIIGMLGVGGLALMERSPAL